MVLARTSNWLSALTGVCLYLLFSFSGVNAFALQYDSVFPKPSPETIAIWNKDLFETDELWVIDDVSEFFAILTDANVNQAARSELMARLKGKPTFEEFAKIQGFYNWRLADGYIFIPAALKAQISHDALGKIYRYLRTTGRSSPFMKFTDTSAAKAHFARLGADPRNEDLYAQDGAIYFFITPDTWARLNDDAKAEFIHTNYLSKDAAQAGLNLILQINDADEVANIAQKYAGSRDPVVLERYLIRRLQQSHGQLTLGLEEILPSPMRKLVNTYSTCSGPDCISAALDMHEGNSSKRPKIETTTQLLDFLKENYYSVSLSEKRHLGDILIYLSDSGEVIHAATHVDNDVVFTKNGITKFNPYLLQWRTQNERLYFPEGDYQLMVFRPSKLTSCSELLLVQ